MPSNIMSMDMIPRPVKCSLSEGLVRAMCLLLPSYDQSMKNLLQ